MAQVRRAWGATIGWGLAAIIGITACVALWRDGRQGWSIVVGILTLGFAALALTTRTAACPSCAQTIKFSMLEFIWCRHCGEYARYRSGKVTKVEPGAIAAEPSFGVPLDDLRPVNEWKAPWPGRCCVCGAAATRALRHTVQVLEGMGALQDTYRKFDAPMEYCAQHDKGVDVNREQDFAASMNERAPLVVKFRSYDYWRAFRTANERPEKRGPGASPVE